MLEHGTACVGGVALGRSRRSSVDGVVAHLVAFEAWNSSHAPGDLQQLLDPLGGLGALAAASSTAFSLSTVMADGSRRGS